MTMSDDVRNDRPVSGQRREDEQKPRRDPNEPPDDGDRAGRSRGEDQPQKTEQGARSRQSQPAVMTRLAGWFSEAILRVTVAIIGIALVLLATGQLLGLNLYSMFADLLTSTIGQWLFVAFIGLLLIGAATKHWGIAGSWQ